MPNVLDIEPVRACARRASAKIPEKRIADRFERLALGFLLSEPRNFRPAGPAELRPAPDWVKRAMDRGEQVSVFKVHRSAIARMHVVARRLATTCAVAATPETARPGYAPAIASARAFLDKFDRVNFDVARQRANVFARLSAIWGEEIDYESVCSPASVPATCERTWRRITSLAEMRAVGREFRNCLANAARSAGYGGALCKGLSQFWVLRDREGEGLVVLMAPLPAAQYFIEVKGPRNTRINPNHPDLRRLSVALGMAPRDPPPTPPAPAAAVRLQCQCMRCAHIAA
ncbi:MAG: hypothetical protein R3C25_05210 [Hyphomonadaceae bacterium]